MSKISRELRHQHEAEVYDAMGEDMLSSLTDDDLVCPVGQIPFHNHEQVDLLTCALDLIRPLDGMKILEIGTGPGLMSTYLAQCGAQVTGLDVSSTILEVARRRAEVNGVSDQITLHTVPAEEFDAPDDSFDAVFGNNVLHHLDLEGSAPNLARLLRPGGRASFCEPVLFTPPFVRAMREAQIVQKRFPLHTHTPDEKSLDMDDIRVLAAPFGSAHWRPVHMACRLQNFVDLSESTFGKIEKFDQFVLDRIKPAARLCRSIVLSLSLEADAETPGPRFRRLDSNSK